MRRLAAGAALLLTCGCSLWRLAPGPTQDGLAVTVAASAPDAARREAVASLLPLFLPASARAAKAGALEKEVLSQARRFVGREGRLGGRRVEEVRLGLLAGALDRADLVRPQGYESGPIKVLLVMSEKDSSLGVGLAADNLRRALSARGIEAQNARDPLNRYPFKAKTVPEALLVAGREGADWLMLGAAAAAAAPDPYSGAWKGRAKVWADLYGLTGSTEPISTSAEATAVDESSAAALGRALAQAGENEAVRVAAETARRRGGRAEITVVVSGTRDPARIKTLLSELRGLDGVAGAALGVWRTDEGNLTLRVFTAGLKSDELAARLLRRDPSILLGGVDPEDNELSLIENGGPGVPGLWE